MSNATLTSITASPANANLAPGSTSTFQATGNYSDGSTANLSGLAVWASSATSVATVNNGVTLGQSAGSANITATYQGQTGTAAVLVTSSPLTAIAVTPVNPTTYVGVGIQFTATGTAGTQQINVTSSAAWASSAPAAATVSNAAFRQGFATGVGQGTATITAVFAGITGTATLNVSNAHHYQSHDHAHQSDHYYGFHPAVRSNWDVLRWQECRSDLAGDMGVLRLNVAPISTAGVASGATPGQTIISASFTQPGQATVVAPPATLTVQ